MIYQRPNKYDLYSLSAIIHRLLGTGDTGWRMRGIIEKGAIDRTVNRPVQRKMEKYQSSAA